MKNLEVTPSPPPQRVASSAYAGALLESLDLDK